MTRSGWYDPLIQNLAYLTFATDAPGYGPLVSNATLTKMHNDYYKPGGCLALEQACYAAGNGSASNAACKTADDGCVRPTFFVSLNRGY